jgi:hypothetical protein
MGYGERAALLAMLVFTSRLSKVPGIGRLLARWLRLQMLVTHLYYHPAFSVKKSVMRTMSFYISLTTLLVVLITDGHLSYHGSELKIIHQPQHWSCFKYLANLRSLNLDISRILPSV